MARTVAGADVAQLLSRNAEVVTSALDDAQLSPMPGLLAARTVAELAEDATRMFVERARLAGHLD